MYKVNNLNNVGSCLRARVKSLWRELLFDDTLTPTHKLPNSLTHTRTLNHLYTRINLCIKPMTNFALLVMSPVLASLLFVPLDVAFTAWLSIMMILLRLWCLWWDDEVAHVVFVDDDVNNANSTRCHCHSCKRCFRQWFRIVSINSKQTGICHAFPVHNAPTQSIVTTTLLY